MKTPQHTKAIALSLLQFLFCLQLMAQSASTCSPLGGNLSANLIAFYPFCGNANDVSGNSNNPTFNNATLTTDRFGNANSAYHFNGTQYISGSCSNYPPNNRTVSVWFNLDNLTNDHELMGYGGGCGSSYFMGLNFSNHPGDYTATRHCEGNNCSTSDAYPPGNGWNNWIVTSTNDSVKFYLNGVLFHSFLNNFNGTPVTGYDFCFGSIPSPAGFAPYTDGNVNYLEGSLDDIAVYNVAFNASQVQELYQHFSTGCTLAATVSPSGTVTICNGATATLTANTGAGVAYQWIKGSADIAGATNQTYAAKKAASYKVRESISGNCTSTSAATTLNVLTSPSAIITPTNGLDLCGHPSGVTLQANTGIAYTYQWMKGANNISGATNSNYTATAKATYKVIVTAGNGCSKTSSGAKVTKSCKQNSGDSNQLLNSFTAYPNPSDGKFFIDLKLNNDQNSEALVQMINMIGQVVYIQKLSVENGVLQKQIQLNNIADGMYLVKVIVDDKVFSQQIVISN